MTTQEIMEILPHRQPFLLIDTVEELEPGVRAVAKKNVTYNEPYFAGHFPGNPVMPGVLIIEALAQTGGSNPVAAGVEGQDCLFCRHQSGKVQAESCTGRHPRT